VSDLIGEGKFYEVDESGKVRFIDSEVEPVKLVGEIHNVKLAHKQSWWRRVVDKLKRLRKKETG